MAVAAVAHHSQQQHVQLAGGFLHHHKISSGDPLNSQSTTSHSSHPAHSGHLVNGTILKTALTNPSEVSPNLFLYFPLSIARAGRRLSLDEYRQSALCLSGIARIYNFTKSLTAERNDLFSMVSDKSESQVTRIVLPSPGVFSPRLLRNLSTRGQGTSTLVPWLPSNVSLRARGRVRDATNARFHAMCPPDNTRKLARDMRKIPSIPWDFSISSPSG